jgi:hypothetical protein
VSTDATLSPMAFKVLERVPLTWWDVKYCEQEISLVLCRPLGDVRRQLTHLRSLNLIEYRRRSTLVPSFEVRRIGKG